MIPVLASVELSDKEMTDVLSTGKQISRRQLGAVLLERHGNRNAKPPAMALGHPVSCCLALRCEGAPHLERGEDVLLHVLLVRHSRNRLYDQAERVVVRVGVSERQAWRVGQPHGFE